MAKPNLKAAPEVDPHRAEAAAITERDDAARVAEAARSAIEGARRMVGNAEERLSQAGRGIADAKGARAAQFTAAASAGTTPALDHTLRDAYFEEAEARDEVEAAKQALAAVEAALADPEYARGKAQERVAAAADAVIAATSIGPLLAAAQAVQDDLVRRRVVLRYLLGARLVSGPEADALQSFLRAREQAIPGAPALGRWPSSVEFQDWDGHPAAEPWKAARELPLRDASAPLPE
jgi:hypothetical protein